MCLRREGWGADGDSSSAGVAGTALFLALVQVFLVFAAVDWRKKGDKTLLAIIITWPLLTIRGACKFLISCSSVPPPRRPHHPLTLYTCTHLHTKNKPIHVEYSSTFLDFDPALDGIVSVEVPEYSCAPLPFPFPPVLLFIVTDHKV